MNLKDPRIRFIFSCLILSVVFLYSYYFKTKNIDIIPTVNAIYVSPEGGDLTFEKRSFNTVTLKDALAKVSPGQTIYLFPGTYSEKVHLSRRATEEKPISIIGSKSSVISGNEEGCIALVDSSWIFLERLHLSGCKVTAVNLQSVDNIYISRLDINDSQNAILATGSDSKNIVIEKSKWTGTSGSFLKSKNITGEIVLRQNQISGGDYGVWLDSDSTDLNNKNVQIYQNNFSNVRQSSIKSSGQAFNWWVHHNQFQGGLNWLSFSGISGGFIYIYGNTGFEIGNSSSVFVLPQATEKSLYPIYIFNNTWLFNETYIANETPSRLIRHFNNILISKSQAPKILTKKNWHPSMKFDHDLLNISPEKPSPTVWKNIVIADPGFESKNDFSLRKGSPAIDRGIKIKIGEWSSEFYSEAPDIGAFESKFAVKGPKYIRR